MNRKHFLSSVVKAGITLPAIPGITPGTEEDELPALIPDYLQPGDMIGITCPAGFITEKEIEPAVLQLKSWGFTVKAGNTVGRKDFTFGGTDEERGQWLGRHGRATMSNPSTGRQRAT